MKLSSVYLALATATVLSVVATTTTTATTTTSTGVVGDEGPPAAYGLEHDDEELFYEQQASTAPKGLLRRLADKVTERGLVIGNILCERGIVDICICSEDRLRAAFDEASTNELLPTLIPLCYGSFFRLTTPIDITGKSFKLTCPRPEQCVFRGGNSNVFIGAPVKALFVFLAVEFSEAEIGGAFYLTGGKTRFINLLLNDNYANVTGGAIYVEGEGTQLAFSGTIFQDNYSYGNGAAITVTKGAKVKAIRSSFLTNFAEGDGGAIYVDSGGSVDLTISLFHKNEALLQGNDLFITSDGVVGDTSVQCAFLLRATFCGGKEGIVVDTNGATNCLKRGVFNIDPRCPILDALS